MKLLCINGDVFLMACSLKLNRKVIYTVQDGVNNNIIQVNTNNY